MSEQDIPTADELRRRRDELGLNTVDPPAPDPMPFDDYDAINRSMDECDRRNAARARGEDPDDPMPTPPEGVTVMGGQDIYCVQMVGDYATAMWVRRGVIESCSSGTNHPTPAVLRYTADLAEWATRQQARTQEAARKAERARLLEAVRVAEEAWEKAKVEHAEASERMVRAEERAGDCRLALSAARKAAGFG